VAGRVTAKTADDLNAPARAGLSAASRLLTQPGMATLATYLRGTIVLLVVIVIATLLYLGSFHFSGHPRRIVYLGTYLVVLAGTIAIMAWHHRRASRPGSLAP
jgi:uncharacterized membrane protein